MGNFGSSWGEEGKLTLNLWFRELFENAGDPDQLGIAPTPTVASGGRQFQILWYATQDRNADFHVNSLDLKQLKVNLNIK